MPSTPMVILRLLIQEFSHRVPKQIVFWYSATPIMTCSVCIKLWSLGMIARMHCTLVGRAEHQKTNLVISMTLTLLFQ